MRNWIAAVLARQPVRSAPARRRQPPSMRRRRIRWPRGSSRSARRSTPIFARYMAEQHVPGLVYGIVADGRLVYVRTLRQPDARPLRAGHAGQPVPHRLDVQGVHRARHPEAARRGPAAARRARPRPMCRSCAAGAIRPAIRPRIRVRDLLSHVGGFVTDDPWGDRQQVLPEAEFTAHAARRRALHPRAADARSNIPISATPCSAGSSATSRAGPIEDYIQRRDHAPARHGLDRLRHRRLAAGAPRASAIAGRMTPSSREPDMRARRVRRDGRRRRPAPTIMPAGSPSCSPPGRRATGRSRARCGARPCARWPRG